MNYISTRGLAPTIGFDDVLLAGLARDGGLYLPEAWPVLSADEMHRFAGMSFADIAVEVIAPYTGAAITRTELADMAAAAYQTFGHPDVTPLRKLTPTHHILELFHGPTLAFKDVAMQLLARMMDHVLAKRGERTTIVGATSGDTGGAAIEAFRTSQRADMIILFPDGRVSDVQRRMMTTAREPNVHAVAIDGTFDDCQALVKAMFNDHAFRDGVKLSGINSINWGRIVAQIPYYFYAASRLGAPETKLSFAVPTGNFGDIFAGFAAKMMGLPIERLIIASNDNDILPRTVATGIYEMRGVVATSSPSMDIQISSNFERYLFEASGRNANLIRRFMADLSDKKRIELGPVWSRLQADFASASASQTHVAETIRAVARDHDYLMDTHTACAEYAVAATAPHATPTVVLATAHPAKFPDALQKITGTRPPLPRHLSTLMTDRERITKLPNDLRAVEDFVAAKSQAVTA